MVQEAVRNRTRVKIPTDDCRFMCLPACVYNHAHEPDAPFRLSFIRAYLFHIPDHPFLNKPFLCAVIQWYSEIIHFSQNSETMDRIDELLSAAAKIGF